MDIYIKQSIQTSSKLLWLCETYRTRPAAQRCHAFLFSEQCLILQSPAQRNEVGRELLCRCALWESTGLMGDRLPER